MDKGIEDKIVEKLNYFVPIGVVNKNSKAVQALTKLVEVEKAAVDLKRLVRQSVSDDGTGKGVSATTTTASVGVLSEENLRDIAKEINKRGEEPVFLFSNVQTRDLMLRDSDTQFRDGWQYLGEVILDGYKAREYLSTLSPEQEGNRIPNQDRHQRGGT
jgi:erythromycin esterase-like protein